MARGRKLCSVDKANVLDTSILWREVDEPAKIDLACKARIDHLRVGPSRAQLFELKTTASAAPRDVERTAESLGYNIAAAAYLRAAWAALPDLRGRIEFCFVFVEIEPPYAVSIFEPDPAFLELGHHRWERAVRIWARCKAEDTWPAYRGLHTLSCPPWVLARYAAGEEV